MKSRDPATDVAPPTTTATAAANFDHVARLYRWAEYLLLGPLLTRTREHFLGQLTEQRHALVLGDGDGRFLARLLRRAPQMQAVAVDGSASMLGLLRQRCGFAGERLRTLQTTAAALPLRSFLGRFDLVVTHFFLDCLAQAEVNELADCVAAHAGAGCLWVISEFAVPRRQPWRSLGRIYIRGLYAAFRVLTGLQVQRLPEITPALQGAGFRCVERAEKFNGLLYSELWQLEPPATREARPRNATSSHPASSTLE